MTAISIRTGLLVVLGILPNIAVDAADPVTVQDTTIATHSGTGARIVKGSVTLPAHRYFLTAPYEKNNGLTEVYLEFESLAPSSPGETRMGKLKELEAARERRYELNQILHDVRRYAQEHGGVGPPDLATLARWKKNLEQNRGLPAPVYASGIYLVPNARVFETKANGEIQARPSNKRVLIDLTPVVNDGKHWILDARNQSRRVDIDAAELKKLGLEVIAPPTKPVEGDMRAFTIFGRLEGQPGKSSFRLRSLTGSEELEIVWDTAAASPGPPEICSEWAMQRLHRLDIYPPSGAAPALESWIRSTVFQYGREGELGPYSFATDPAALGPREDRTIDAMGVLGGRAAIEETLQLRNLRAAAEDEESWDPSVPVEEIAGVQVQAHPFEEMLQGEAGGTLPLADWVPHDHFMVYFPQPEKIFSLLEGGSDFVFATGASVTGRSASHHLKERYRSALGLSEEIMKRFLATGAVQEMAVVLPDLFLIDGTEMSVVMRTARPLLTNTALALIGIPPGDGQTIKTNRHGESVYWLRQGTILIVSTSEREVGAVLQAKEEGNGLGPSAELRYMLTQVPVTEETVAYGYLSDPFIRHLVSPETKIGQLRRLAARAELEDASAAALLATFDGHGARANDLPFLQERGYVTRPLYAADLQLDGQAVSSSGFYGRAARLSSLTDLPLELVSANEQEAYNRYREEYDRYWRRYFDPIAVRYEQKPDNNHELETFILPLIENSLYDGLRGALAGEDEPTPLQVPVLDPTPIAMLSCNLGEEAWMQALEELMEVFEQFLGLNPGFLDLLGPDVHIALHDADPIITLGNGELQGLLGSFGDDGGEMVLITALASSLTRPCTVHIGLQNPEEARKALAGMATFPADHDSGDFGRGSLYQIGDQNRWIYKFEIENIVTLRFGVEVQDRYLVINNLPFSNDVTVTGHAAAPDSAASFQLNPAACEKQLRALFASAAEGMRDNALSGAAALFPLTASGSDLETAKTRHLELFGFSPTHPGEGRWRWDVYDGLVSSLYGPPWINKQPAFDATADELGLLKDISSVRVDMQFEQDGLRSNLRWRLKE